IRDARCCLVGSEMCIRDSASNEFVIGYRYLMENSAIEVMAIENARNMDNSTDIAFTFGYRYLFAPDNES
ncbi:DUF3187 family protein, partial [Vibrio harveyi]|uniref:DUF3187 family protein n=1 Tax=Vibrio harveyi TaxID=669 RepID=UPI0018F1B46A